MPNDERTLSLIDRTRPPRVATTPARLGRTALGSLRRLLGIFLTIGLSALLVAGLLTPLAGAASTLLDKAHDVLGTHEPAPAFPRLPERSTILARDGAVLAKLYLDENRTVVSVDDVPQHTIDAVLAAEDDDFYRHGGIDLQAVARASLRNLASGEVRQGGSTITQQVARNVFESVGTVDTLRRKIREAQMTLRLERVYSKDEILEIYLNEVYLGHGVYGVATASEWYFGKGVGDLTVPESALLAGLIAAPERFSPENDRDAARERRGLILDRMVEAGLLDASRAEEADAEKIELSTSKRKILRRSKAPFFVELIKRRILDDSRFGETRADRIRTLFQGGLTIHTTLDLKLQRAGRKITRRHLPRKSDPESAVVVVRPKNGAIRALIGGRDFTKQKFDLASQGRRQAGSAFKPFTLVAALERGISPDRRYDSSSPTVIQVPGAEPWRVRNASRRSYGRIDLRTATQNSVNTVFARLIQDVGPERVVRTAKRMGIESDLPAVPSLTLGTAPVSPLEMASGFATLANRGRHCRPFAIRTVVDRDGEEIFRQRRSCERTVRAGIAARAVRMLQRVVRSGTGTAARLDRWPMFGKTGTTDDYGDAWFVGCTRQLCASSWVGHIEGRIPMTNVHGIRVFGGTFPARIWRDVMGTAMRGRKALGFPEPPPVRAEKDRARNVTVPDVVGLQVDRARHVLRDAGLEVEARARRTGSPDRDGEVLRQSPPGGEKAPEGSAVSLTVLRHRSDSGSGPGGSGKTETQEEVEEEAPVPGPVETPVPGP